MSEQPHDGGAPVNEQGATNSASDQLDPELMELDLPQRLQALQTIEARLADELREAGA